jgi:hypothetical protein
MTLAQAREHIDAGVVFRPHPGALAEAGAYTLAAELDARGIGWGWA